MQTEPGAEIESYLAWSRAAEPFWQYVAATPFYGHAGLTSTKLPTAVAAKLIDKQILPVLMASEGRLGLWLDLPPRLSIAAIPALREVGFLIVPVILRWPLERPLLPVDTVTTYLVALSPPRQPVDPSGVVFILDGERDRAFGARMLASHSDNRYLYPLDLFPSPEMLREWGARQGLIITISSTLPSDLQEMRADMIQGGLPVSHQVLSKTK